jgi:polyphosphate kinase 2
MTAKTDTQSKPATHNKARKSAKPSGFDLENPELPPEIEERALSSGGYPYAEKLKGKVYKKRLVELQLELLKLQEHIQGKGERLVVLFEGRDASGKGSCISRFLARLNPRHARSVALAKPTEAERGEWYFQRYVSHLPTKGDIVLFDRSWYNRSGVERVMGFCTEEQVSAFLRDAPEFEALLVRDGVRLFKFYLTIGREMQLLRFHERRHNPFKRWKITEIDLAAIEKWDVYTEAQRDTFRFTHTAISPWMVIRANDQRRARLEAIRTVLAETSYEGKDEQLVGKPDPLLVGAGPEFFYAD